MGRAVDAGIGEMHPRRQMLLERGERVEGQLRQPIALDVFDARLRFAFGPGAIRRTRARLHVPVATEGEVGGMEPDRPGHAVAAEHQRARIVAEQRPRHAAEMRERRGDPLAPIVLALSEKRFDEQAAGVTEHGHEEKDGTATPAIRTRFWPKSICSWSPGAVSTRTVATSATRCARRIGATARSIVRTLADCPCAASSRCTTTALPAAAPS